MFVIIEYFLEIGLNWQWREAIAVLLLAGLIDLYIRLVRWIALTAEKTGRPFIGWMVFSILMPLLAALIVIMFKNSAQRNPATQ